MYWSSAAAFATTSSESDLIGLGMMPSVVQQPTVTISTYLWSLTTEGAAKAEVSQKTSAPTPVPFTGLFFRYVES